MRKVLYNGGVVISRRLRLTANVQSQFEIPRGQCVKRPPQESNGRPDNYSDAGQGDLVPVGPWRSAAARSSSNWSMRRAFGVRTSSTRIMRRIATSSPSSLSMVWMSCMGGG